MSPSWSFYVHRHTFSDGGWMVEWVVYGPAERGYTRFWGSGTASSEDEAAERARAYIAERDGSTTTGLR